MTHKYPRLEKCFGICVNRNNAQDNMPSKRPEYR